MPTDPNPQVNVDDLPDPDEPGIDADERQRRLDARNQAVQDRTGQRKP